MKRIPLLALACALFTIFSCQTEENELLLENESSIVNKSVADLKTYQGLRTTDRFGVLSNEVNAKVGDDEEPIPITDWDIILASSDDVLEQIYNMISEEFPYDLRYDMMIFMIQTDFPDLITTADIEANVDIIDEYYGEALSSRVVEVFNEYFTLVSVKGKRTSIAPTKTTNNNIDDDEYDRDCLMELSGYNERSSSIRFRARLALRKAERAFTATDSRYAHLNPTNTQRDAYRNMAWSGLLANYYRTLNFGSRSTFARLMGETNELCKVNHAPATAMDFHNYLLGRQLYRDEAHQYSVAGSFFADEIYVSAGFEAQTGIFINIAGLSESEIVTMIENTDVGRAVWISNELLEDPTACPGVINPITMQCCDDWIFYNGLVTYVGCD